MGDLEQKVLRVVRDNLDGADEARLAMCRQLLDAILGDTPEASETAP